MAWPGPGGDSMTHYAADTWAVVDARERVIQPLSVVGVVALSPPVPGQAMARCHHHIGRTTRAWDSPVLGCAVARRIP